MRGVGAAPRVFELLDRPPVIPPDVPGAPKHPRAAEILKAIGGPVDPATLPPAAPVRFEGVRFEVSGWGVVFLFWIRRMMSRALLMPYIL